MSSILNWFKDKGFDFRGHYTIDEDLRTLAMCIDSMPTPSPKYAEVGCYVGLSACVAMLAGVSDCRVFDTFVDTNDLEITPHASDRSKSMLDTFYSNIAKVFPDADGRDVVKDFQAACDFEKTLRAEHGFSYRPSVDARPFQVSCYSGNSPFNSDIWFVDAAKKETYDILHRILCFNARPPVILVHDVKTSNFVSSAIATISSAEQYRAASIGNVAILWMPEVHESFEMNLRNRCKDYQLKLEIMEFINVTTKDQGVVPEEGPRHEAVKEPAVEPGHASESAPPEVNQEIHQAVVPPSLGPFSSLPAGNPEELPAALRQLLGKPVAYRRAKVHGFEPEINPITIEAQIRSKAADLTKALETIMEVAAWADQQKDKDYGIKPDLMLRILEASQDYMVFQLVQISASLLSEARREIHQSCKTWSGSHQPGGKGAAPQPTTSAPSAPQSPEPQLDPSSE